MYFGHISSFMTKFSVTKIATCSLCTCVQLGAPDKFDMKIFVNVARLEIGQLFTQGVRLGHPCTLDTFLVS